jgi:hypothetical protein
MVDSHLLDGNLGDSCLGFLLQNRVSGNIQASLALFERERVIHVDIALEFTHGGQIIKNSAFSVPIRGKKTGENKKGHNDDKEDSGW